MTKKESDLNKLLNFVTKNKIPVSYLEEIKDMIHDKLLCDFIVSKNTLIPNVVQRVLNIDNSTKWYILFINNKTYSSLYDDMNYLITEELGRGTIGWFVAGDKDSEICLTGAITNRSRVELEDYGSIQVSLDDENPYYDIISDNDFHKEPPLNMIDNLKYIINHIKS